MTPNEKNTATVKFEIPRRACPGYIIPFLGDRTREQGRVAPDEIPPGHRFLLYVQTVSGKGTNKYEILREVAHLGSTAEDFLRSWNHRADLLLPEDGWIHEAELIAPLVTGTGNPHSVENGFAFLAPYGVPYIAGSGVKGVLRRAAEELALFEPSSPHWTLSLVWVLFGFDENSAWYRRTKADSEWCEAYQAWFQKHAPNDELLMLWVDSVRGQAPREFRHLSPSEFVDKLQSTPNLRRSIHWQGLVGFWDAVPRPGARLGVDILNPHHRTYYLEGDGATPHDAENPTPVYFLVVAPGARFTFRAQILPGRPEMARAVEQMEWRALLDKAFEKACEELGFGAKGTVGYGHMEFDRKARERWHAAREDARRAEELARHPWRAHLSALEAADNWGSFRQIVERDLLQHLSEPEVGRAIEQKAKELRRKKWDNGRDQLVRQWLEASGIEWAAEEAEATVSPETAAWMDRIRNLPDWGAWKTAGIRVEDLPAEALPELKKKFREWGCDNRKAKKDKKAAWKQLESLLRSRRR